MLPTDDDEHPTLSAVPWRGRYCAARAWHRVAAARPPCFTNVTTIKRAFRSRSKINPADASSRFADATNARTIAIHSLRGIERAERRLAAAYPMRRHEQIVYHNAARARASHAEVVPVIDDLEFVAVDQHVSQLAADRGRTILGPPRDVLPPLKHPIVVDRLESEPSNLLDSPGELVAIKRAGWSDDSKTIAGRESTRLQHLARIRRKCSTTEGTETNGASRH